MEERPAIGATLREARLRQNLEISECAHATRIRERYLVAIEDGRYESLPDPAYVNGFVRAYADHLGVVIDTPVYQLPSDHLLAPLAGRPRPPQARTPRVAARRVSRRRWLTPKVILPLLIVIAVVVLAWLGAIDMPFG